MRSHILLLLCVLLNGVLVGQPVLPTITNLDLPTFDSSGHLIRRLKAETAIGWPNELTLKSGTVEFFGPDEAKPIGVLKFEDATYRKAAEIIESDRAMQFEFSGGTVAAVGFRHELPTGHLHLHSAVVLTLPEAHVTGNEGDVLIGEAKADRGLVSSATIRGDVTITEFKLNGVDADRLETTSATYTGADSMLSPASPVSAWKKGRKAGELGGKMSFPVGRQPKTPVARASDSASEKK